MPLELMHLSPFFIGSVCLLKYPNALFSTNSLIRHFRRNSVDTNEVSHNFVQYCCYLQVKIEALNDSRQIGMCVYNVVVLSAVALMLTLLLQEQVAMVYGVTSGCVLIGTTTTQFIVFLPKVNIPNVHL